MSARQNRVSIARFLRTETDQNFNLPAAKGAAKKEGIPFPIRITNFRCLSLYLQCNGLREHKRWLFSSRHKENRTSYQKNPYAKFHNSNRMKNDEIDNFSIDIER